MTDVHAARTLREDVLARAAEDWLDASGLLDVVQRSGLTDGALLRDLALGTLAGLVADDLVVLGDLGPDGHVPWSESVGEAVLRAAREWTARKEPAVMIGEVFWIDTTAAGQAIGESVWAREAAVAHP